MNRRTAILRLVQGAVGGVLVGLPPVRPVPAALPLVRPVPAALPSGSGPYVSIELLDSAGAVLHTWRRVSLDLTTGRLVMPVDLESYEVQHSGTVTWRVVDAEGRALWGSGVYQSVVAASTVTICG